MAEQQRTVADAFNQYHRNYVKPNIDSKLSISTAQSDYAKKADLTNGAIIPKKASQLETARSLQVSLSSGAAQTFDGTADKKNIGVTGILPVANGGTGASSLANITVGAATKASQDGSGNVITSTYAKVSDITGGNITAKNATNAVTATKATGDKNGLDIAANYLKITDAANDYLGRHGTADAATKASQDGNGKVISSTYAVKSDLTDGTITVKNATNATTCTGNAATATKLKTARDIKVNLASTNAGSFDGTASISAGVTGILPVANGGTGVTSKDALMEKLYLAKNITTSNDFKNSAGDRDMDYLTVPGIYEMDSANSGSEQWLGLPTYDRCIIEVFKTTKKQVIQSVTKLTGVDYLMAVWRRFGINVGTDEEQWSDWSRILTAPGTSGVLPVANGGTGASSLANITVGTATTATSASKVTGGTVSLTGTVTGSASFGSNGNVSIATTVGKVANATNADSAAACTGNAATATKLKTARDIKVNLASTNAGSFDGAASISAGVTGVLPVANGGTGASSLANITVGAATKASQDGSGNVITTTYATAANLTKVIDGTTKVAKATNADSAAACTGNAATATKLKTARDIKVNLASTNAGSFDGTASISAGVTGILPVENGGTGVTSKDALMEKLYLAKNITTSNDFKNSAGDRDMDYLTVPGIYEMDSANSGSEQWLGLPTYDRCIIEVFKTAEKQVIQRVTKLTGVDYPMATWRRFGINVGTDEERWSDWSREVVALNNGGSLNRGVNVTQNEDHFVDRETDRRIDFNYVITPGTYFVNKPNDATIHWENMPWNTQSFSLLEVFELPESDSTSYILQRFTIVNSDNPTMYIRSGTHYIVGDVRDIWKAWKKIEATTIS